MFKTKAKKDSSKAQTPAPTQNEGPYKNPEVNKAVKYFKQICKHRKVDAIDKHDFKMLISKLVMESGEVTILERDVEEAFILADEDKGGTVDENEFVHLYEMVLANEVQGLHISKSQKLNNEMNLNLKVRKESFKEKLNDKRQELKNTFWKDKANEHEKNVLVLFEQIDTDQSGSIDIHELRNAAPLLNITENEAIELFSNFEIDDDGKIGLEEFRDHYSYETMEDELKRFSSRAQAAVDEEAKEVFTKIDVAKTGHILKEDFRLAAATLNISEDEADAIFYDLDADGNGDIDMDEFYAKYSTYKKKIAVIDKRKATIYNGSEYTSGVQDELKMNQEYRKTVGAELNNAKEEWLKRRKAEALKTKLIQERIQQRKAQDEADAIFKITPMTQEQIEQENQERINKSKNFAEKQLENQRMRAERVRKMNGSNGGNVNFKLREELFEKDFQTKLKKAETDRLKHIAGYKPKAWTAMFGGFMKGTSHSEPSSPRSPISSPSSSSSPRSKSPLPGSSGWKSPLSSLISKKRRGSKKDGDEGDSPSNKNKDVETTEKKRQRINNQRLKVDEIKKARVIRAAETVQATKDQMARAKETSHHHDDSAATGGGGGGGGGATTGGVGDKNAPTNESNKKDVKEPKEKKKQVEVPVEAAVEVPVEGSVKESVNLDVDLDAEVEEGAGMSL